MKYYLNSNLSERIGHLTRGHDYWWEITDEVLKEFTLEEYYDTFLMGEIKASASHLADLSAKKENRYSE